MVTITELLSRLVLFNPKKYKKNLVATLVSQRLKLCYSYLSFHYQVIFKIKLLLKQSHASGPEGSGKIKTPNAGAQDRTRDLWNASRPV